MRSSISMVARKEICAQQGYLRATFKLGKEKFQVCVVQAAQILPQTSLFSYFYRHLGKKRSGLRSYFITASYKNIQFKTKTKQIKNTLEKQSYINTKDINYSLLNSRRTIFRVGLIKITLLFLNFLLDI